MHHLLRRTHTQSHDKGLYYWSTESESIEQMRVYADFIFAYTAFAAVRPRITRVVFVDESKQPIR